MRAMVLSCALWFLAPATLVLAAPEANQCGCFRESDGSCRCSKGAKCGCPGDCEPVGCEAKREKQAEREAEAALKRINEKEKKKHAEAARDAKKKAKAKPKK
jgi:hypothetical protein